MGIQEYPGVEKPLFLKVLKIQLDVILGNLLYE